MLCRAHAQAQVQAQAGWLFAAVCVFVVGCSTVFDDFTRPNPDSCVVNPELCTASQYCNQMTALCEDLGSQDMRTGMDMGAGTCVTNLSLCTISEICNFKSALCEKRNCTPDGWCEEPSGTLKNLSAVWSWDSQNVWAVGDTGTIRHFDGVVFTGMNPINIADLNTVWGSQPNDVWVSGQGGGITTHWDGSAYSNLTCALANGFGIWSFSPSLAWYVGSTDQVFRWNGSGWSSVTIFGSTSTNFRHVWGSGASDVWAVGTGGYIVHWNGTTLSAVTSGTSADLYGLHGLSSTDVWSCGSGGTVRRWDGAMWRGQTSGTAATLRGVYSSSATERWVVGDGGVILRWNGTSFSPRQSGTTVNLLSIHGNTREIWAVGDGGLILRNQRRN